MLAKTYILTNLKNLDIKFQKSSTAKDELYYSKLAILELCGWIEESMDDIVLRCAKKCIKDSKNFDYVKKEIIKRTYAFDYEKFRFMMMRVIGLVNVERIETKINPAVFILMTSTLATLKKERDAEAHTHIKGVLRVINAPSVTITRFGPVYSGIKAFDVAIRMAKI
jgi:hypothetical protein